MAFDISQLFDLWDEHMFLLESFNFLILWCVWEEGTLNERVYFLAFLVQNVKICLVRHFELWFECLALAIEHFFVFVRVRDTAEFLVYANDGCSPVVLSSSAGSTSHLEILTGRNSSHFVAIEFHWLGEDDCFCRHVKSNCKSGGCKYYF